MPLLSFAPIVVNATVRVTHQGSGLERADEVGTSGAYDVQFDKLQLQVGQTRTLDAKLDIATAATTIDVREYGRGAVRRCNGAQLEDIFTMLVDLEPRRSTTVTQF